MKIKKILIILFICFIYFSRTTIAMAIPISNTYKQGIYQVNDTGQYNVTAKLISCDNSACLLIVDPNNNMKLYVNCTIPGEIFNLGLLDYCDTIVIIGKGELSINYHN